MPSAVPGPLSLNLSLSLSHFSLSLSLCPRLRQSPTDPMPAGARAAVEKIKCARPCDVHACMHARERGQLGAHGTKCVTYIHTSAVVVPQCTRVCAGPWTSTRSLAADHGRRQSDKLQPTHACTRLTPDAHLPPHAPSRATSRACEHLCEHPCRPANLAKH